MHVPDEEEEEGMREAAAHDALSNKPEAFSNLDGHFEHAAVEPTAEGDPTKRNFAYFMLGSARFLYASAVRLAVIKLVASMSASADVLAMSTVEVKLDAIQECSTVTIKWRGKPVFIRRRSAAEIARAQADDSAADLKHREADSERVQNPEWLVVLGVCTHLGCVPISDAGDYHGWFCPCHGSHYDISGRIRRGPAPLNLEVPAYKFIEGNKLLIG